MKGVILSGGSGSRLRPLTKVTSKQLLPVYNKPMIYYPLRTLLKAGIKEILIIIAPEHSGDYVNLLGSGSQFGARFSYEVQDKPIGLAHGLFLAESFADGDQVTMILGDNIFEDDFSKDIKSFSGGAKIFAKEVSDPQRFGIVEFDEQGKVISIEEKPEKPKSNYAQPGLYIYEGGVFAKIRSLKPSARGEYEITDLNNIYLHEGELTASIVKGEWKDAGTFESLFQASELARKLALTTDPALAKPVRREVGPFTGFHAKASAGMSGVVPAAQPREGYDPFFDMNFPHVAQMGLSGEKFVIPPVTEGFSKARRRILVTGGAGFMGSNMIHYLLKKYDDVAILNLDKLTYAGNLENLTDVEKNSRYVFVKGDISDVKTVNTLCKAFAFDAVINYAAETHVDRSIMDPSAFLYTDIIGTYNLLEAVKKYRIGTMIQISTDEVFGEAIDREFVETSPFEPNSPYSASKAGGDHLCRAYFRTYKTPVIVTHSCNFYGPYQYPEKLIPLFITNLLEKKKVPVYGQGDQIREWIYTEDHCRAIDLILEKGLAGEVYNIGTGERMKNIDVTRMILRMLDMSDSHIEYVTDRPGHDVRYAVNADKLRERLGWEPKHSFKESLQLTLDWYQKNMDWWKDIKSGKFLEYYQKQYGDRKK